MEKRIEEFFVVTLPDDPFSEPDCDETEE